MFFDSTLLIPRSVRLPFFAHGDIVIFILQVGFCTFPSINLHCPTHLWRGVLQLCTEIITEEHKDYHQRRGHFHLTLNDEQRRRLDNHRWRGHEPSSNMEVPFFTVGQSVSTKLEGGSICTAWVIGVIESSISLSMSASPRPWLAVGTCRYSDPTHV